MMSPIREWREWTDEKGAYHLHRIFKPVGGPNFFVMASYSRIAKRILYWINRSPDSFTKEDWEALRYEISALADLHYGFAPDEWKGLVGYSTTYSVIPADQVLHEPIPADQAVHKLSFRVPNQVDAQHFLKVVSEFVAPLAEGHNVEVGPLSLTIPITRKTPHMRPPSITRLFYVTGKTIRKRQKAAFNFPNLVDQAIYQFVRALQACGGLVVKCPECSQIFLADRINQKYCSPRCLSRVTTRRSRTSQKEVKSTAKDRKGTPKRVVKRSSKEKN